MKKFVLTSILFCLFLNNSLAVEEVTCDDFKGKIFSQSLCFLDSSCSKKVGTFNIDFGIATEKRREPLMINEYHGKSLLESSSFDPTKKTYLITHGFWSYGNVSWITELKDAILDTHEFNVIIIDWCDGCNTYNYVDAAKNTKYAAEKIYEFLYKLQQAVRNATSQPFVEEKWNHLHIVGHSLGAHVSGVLGNLIRQNKASNLVVERITGLDPAGPCFEESSENLRLNSDDAEFVDVIHTQHSDMLTLGSKRSAGHIDFFVNGGARQPVKAETFLENWDGGRVKSHGLSYEYFIESFKNYKSKSCKFEGHPWDGTYEKARQILDFVSQGLHCLDCPQMGYGAAKSVKAKKFLVITGTKPPYCNFEASDYDIVKNSLKKLKNSPMDRKFTVESSTQRKDELDVDSETKTDNKKTYPKIEYVD